ncbi:MAG: two-component system, OmpR family, alkaline phosphatase synthesis response regulator PhoP [Solirubrobacterales bacterium]|nr:two-component system, OmpR family, alkaline phosphatase synthesis response regulator PhoP [Solirubrobacterales bacterium]MDX6661952.1 two-component system, OmpR family, alkaline phosphatase synthesis response regulator PhoP [Solirubrobacterales bacterium]
MSTDADKRTILIAEDEPDIRDLVSFRLERAGYDVILAEDGQEALEMAIEHRPDLAILDVMMPRMDGLELTRRIRAEQTIAGMPIILLTASVQDQAVTEGFRAGADDYMRKPFSPQELLSRVEAVLGRK